MNDFRSLDSATDQRFSEQRIHASTVVSNFSRPRATIAADDARKAADVLRSMTHLKALCGMPKRIQVDHGSRFIPHAPDYRAHEHKVPQDFCSPGQLAAPPLAKAGNRSFRDECLNVHWPLSPGDSREKTKTGRQGENPFRPHSSPCNPTPREFRPAHIDSQNPRGVAIGLRREHHHCLATYSNTNKSNDTMMNIFNFHIFKYL